MEFAKRVLAEYECRKKFDNLTDSPRHPLLDVISLLAKETQFKHISFTLLHFDELIQNYINCNTLFFSENEPLTKDKKNLHDIIININTSRTINLSRDLIFPWPWEENRLSNTIARIGVGRSCETFEQTPNHDTTLWLPLGLTWVHCGNHSISSAILQGEGSLLVNKVYDISPLYDHWRS
jgi:hypothetical protein